VGLMNLGPKGRVIPRLTSGVRFSTELTREIRRRVGPGLFDFFRWSQWKQETYQHRSKKVTGTFTIAPRVANGIRQWASPLPWLPSGG
jgi:hypothetical protein